MCLYAVEKLFIREQLSSYSESQLHDPTGSITLDMGFNIAFALTPYEGDLLRKYEDETIVTLEAELYEWGVPENSLVSQRIYTKLKTHPCSAEEVGVSATNKHLAKFYPPQPESAIDVKRILGNWHCLDEEQDRPFDLFGNYDSGKAQALRINLMLCNPKEVT